jgi:hypothetical protein
VGESHERAAPSDIPVVDDPGRLFTVAEVESMAAKGILAEDERLEPIGSE